METKHSQQDSELNINKKLETVDKFIDFLGSLSETANAEEFRYSINFITHALKGFVIDGYVTSIASEDSEEWYEDNTKQDKYPGQVYNHSRCPNIFKVDKVVYGDKFIFQDAEGSYYSGTAKIKDTEKLISSVVKFKSFPIDPSILVIKVIKEGEELIIDVPDIEKEIAENLPNVELIYY